MPYREAIQAIDLHAFADASGGGTCAAVYAVIQQNQGTVQGLVASKSHLAKKSLTIPRLELVSGLMATKLLDNIKAVLDGLPIRHCYSWLDSMVALYWISGRGSLQQAICCKSSKAHSREKLHYMETRRNEGKPSRHRE